MLLISTEGGDRHMLRRRNPARSLPIRPTLQGAHLNSAEQLQRERARHDYGNRNRRHQIRPPRQERPFTCGLCPMPLRRRGHILLHDVALSLLTVCGGDHTLHCLPLILRLPHPPKLRQFGAHGEQQYANMFMLFVSDLFTPGKFIHLRTLLPRHACHRRPHKGKFYALLRRYYII